MEAGVFSERVGRVKGRGGTRDKDKSRKKHSHTVKRAYVYTSWLFFFLSPHALAEVLTLLVYRSSRRCAMFPHLPCVLCVQGAGVVWVCGRVCVCILFPVRERPPG